MSLAALMPSDISAATLAALMAVALIGSIARGFSGFGGALIFMPLAAAVIGPRAAAALYLIIDFVAAVPLLPNAWKLANRKAIGLMAAGSAVGIPVGTYALTHLDTLVSRWIISAFVFALLVLLMSGWRYRGKGPPAVALGTGVVSGFCGGLAQTSGPPVMAYWLGQPVPSNVARASVMLLFGVTSIFTAASYYVGGLLTAEVFRLALWIGPTYALGLFIGARFFGVASETLFRRVCYSLIALAALVSLPALDPLLGR